MPQDKILLGQQEYLIQTTEKELFYIKVTFYGSKMEIVMPSDRLAPTSGGIRYTGFSSETVSKIPLAQYEQTVAKQAVMERGMLSYGSTSTGRRSAR